MVRLPDPPEGLAVLALPDPEVHGPGPYPAMVVIHDITGLRPDTVRHCRRFAEEGYAAGAPQLFGSVGCILRTLAHATRERAHPVVEHARQALVELDEVNGEQVGVIGFCMGGGFAITAASTGHYAVALPFYGTVPEHPHAMVGICPTLGQFGGQDRPFRRYARRLTQHLSVLGVPHEVIVHEDAGHSFMNDHRDQFPEVIGDWTPLRARYVPAVEARAWRKMLAFLAKHMPAPAR